MRLVLWDIDGTLVHTAGHGRHAFGEAFAAVFGREIDVTALEMAGRTDHSISRALLEANAAGEDDSHLPRMLEELNVALERRRERIAAEGWAEAGAREALEALAERPDVVQSLLTGNIEQNAALKLSAFGLDRHLDLEIGGYGSHHGVRAELVGIAREKAARLRGMEVDPSDTVLVGDTPLDVEAARGAGARAVAVATGPYGVEELERAEPDTVLPDLRDTAAVLRAVGLEP